MMIYRAFTLFYGYVLHYLREDKLFSSRGETFLLARVKSSPREEKNFCMVSFLKMRGLVCSVSYYRFY